MVWRFLKRVAENLEEDHPDCYISTSAYPPIQFAPRERLPKNVLLLKLAVEGPYEEFVPGMKESVEAQVGAWRKVIDTSQVSLFHYANAAGWNYGYRSDRGICGSLPRTYGAHYKRISDRGTGTRLYLNPHSWIYDHLSIYVFYRAHWNTDMDVDGVLDEYYKLFGSSVEFVGSWWLR